METIASEVKSCQKCGLCKTRTNAVPGAGPYRCRIVIVAEAPGRKEDETGLPFQGDAGSNLNGLLDVANIGRQSVFITNVVKCRPSSPHGNRKPTPDEVDACIPYLKRQLELLQPEMVVLLGATALNAFFPDKTIGAVHGKVLELGGRRFFVTFHPAAKIYNRELAPLMDDDFTRLGRLMTN